MIFFWGLRFEGKLLWLYIDVHNDTFLVFNYLCIPQSEKVEKLHKTISSLFIPHVYQFKSLWALLSWVMVFVAWWLHLKSLDNFLELFSSVCDNVVPWWLILSLFRIDFTSKCVSWFLFKIAQMENGLEMHFLRKKKILVLQATIFIFGNILQ